MALTLKQAAEQTGKSKQAIQQAIKKGKLSAAKDANQQWRIEPAELFRVYAPVKPVETQPLTPIDNALQGVDTASQLRIKELELEIKAKELEIGLITKRVGELESDRDQWREQANRLLLTTEPPQKPLQTAVEPQGGFWARWLGKGER